MRRLFVIPDSLRLLFIVCCVGAFGLAGSSQGQSPGSENLSATKSDSKLVSSPFRGFFRWGQDADIMLSGIDFNNTGGPLLFNHPTGIASDGVRFLVADRWNNRVLVWNSLPTGNTPPDIVLGQKNFITNNPGVGKDEMNWPGNVCVSPEGKLAVADIYNDRILIWNSFPGQSGASADLVLDLPRLSPQGAPMRYGWPWGVWTDGKKLAVVATHGASVLIWNSFPTTDNKAPDWVLTSPNMGTPRNVTSDGKYFIVSDHNARQGENIVSGTFFWEKFPTSATQPPDFFRREWLKGCFTDDGRLIMGGLGAFYIWNKAPEKASDEPTLTVRDPAYANGDGPDVVYAGGKLYVCNYNGNNILVYNGIPTSTDQPPEFAIGSPDARTNTLHTHKFIQNPVIASNGNSLFVSSDFDRTLSVWRTLPEKSGTQPDVVTKLQDGPWDNALWDDTLVLAGRRSVLVWTKLPLNGESPTVSFRDNIGSVQFQELMGVALDDKYFYLSDASGKVWIWSGIPKAETPSEPILTLEVNRPGRLSSDGKHLVVMRTDPPEIRVYRVADLDSQTAVPIKVLSGFPLNLPMHAITFGDKLAVANTCNNAVYVWDHIQDAGDYSTCAILGADYLNDFKPEIGRNKLFWPGSLCFDGRHLWVGEFKFSIRILRFTP